LSLGLEYCVFCLKKNILFIIINTIEAGKRVSGCGGAEEERREGLSTRSGKWVSLQSITCQCRLVEGALCTGICKWVFWKSELLAGIHKWVFWKK
jgi:hypothetical protein